MKFLVVVIVVVAVLWLMFGRRRGGPSRRAPGSAEEMVRCAHCGIHLPRSEAFLQGGRPYCSTAHRDLGVSGR